MLGISVGEIKENEIKHLEGYSWKTDEETREQWNKAKEMDLGKPIVGEICMDLIDTDGNIIGTITISKEEYLRIRG